MSEWANEQMTDEPAPAPSGSEGANDLTEDKSRLISLAEAAEIYGFDHDYLGELARKTRLRARKSGGVWLTTPEAVEEYIRSRKKRGAFRKDIRA